MLQFIAYVQHIPVAEFLCPNYRFRMDIALHENSIREFKVIDDFLQLKG